MLVSRDVTRVCHDACMVYADTMRYWDCGWCGVKDVAMRFAHKSDANRTSGVPRGWALLYCPRCGGATLLETSGTDNIPLEVGHLPEVGATTSIDGVPDDVAKYYNEAHIAVQAGLIDASAVELPDRPTRRG